VSSFRTATRLPVVVEDTAEQTGEVTGFVVDPDHATVHALHVGGKHASARFVSWEDIAAFGADAVIVKGSTSVHDSSDDHEQRSANGELEMLDKRVLTDVGDELGVIEDVDFDPLDGHLEHVTVGGGRVDPGRLIGIGTYAVIVTAEDDD
jgi:uncharacterized protein YrrD